MSAVEEKQGLAALLRLYARYDRELPAVAHADGVQEDLAYHLARAGRHENAARIYRYLAEHATNPHIRERAQKDLTGGANGH